MRKHIVLTSLVAIGIAANANAATTNTSDVTFAGNYTLTDGTTKNIADSVTSDTYTYKNTAGSDVTKNLSEDPVDEDFVYTKPDGSSDNYSDDITYTASDYTVNVSDTTTLKDASENVIGTLTTTTTDFIAGEAVNRNTYKYTDTDGNEFDLGESAPDATDTLTLANGTVVDIVNGNASIGDDAITSLDGTTYTFTAGGKEYSLSTDGTEVWSGQEKVTPADGTELATKANEMRSKYTADSTSLTEKKAETSIQFTKNEALFNAADKQYGLDETKVNKNTTAFDSIAIAQKAKSDAAQAKTDVESANSINSQAKKDAEAIYKASITETITNGANDAITDALATDGSITSAIDTKVADEATRAQAEETAIRGEFAAADTALQTSINAESDRAQGVESALDTRLTATESTIGDTSEFVASSTKNISNGGDTNATTVSGAIANIDATLGTIHGLNAKRGADAKGNLATGTTVEQHLVALDDAIGDRSALSGDYVTAGADVATNLQSLNDGIEAAMSYAETAAYNTGALTLRSAQAYTDKRVDDLEKEMSAGIASAAALSSVAVSNVKKGEVSVGGGYGYHNSQSAMAFGAALGITDNWSVNAGAGVARESATFRAGTNYKFKLF